MLSGKRFKSGFTLLELMVVVTIIAILAAVITANFMEAKAKARDAERQSNIRELKSAIELYKNKYGLYPEACNGETVVTAPTPNWSGQIGSNYACADGTNNYIVDLAPEFIQTLPVDKKVKDGDRGYVYTVNKDRTIYKLKAKGTVETETVDYTHPLKSCDIRVGSHGGVLESGTFEEAGLCSTVSFSYGNIATDCKDVSSGSDWQTSYGAWGGFAEVDSGSNAVKYRSTTGIICR